MSRSQFLLPFLAPGAREPQSIELWVNPDVAWDALSLVGQWIVPWLAQGDLVRLCQVNTAWQAVVYQHWLDSQWCVKITGTTGLTTAASLAVDLENHRHIVLEKRFDLCFPAAVAFVQVRSSWYVIVDNEDEACAFSQWCSTPAAWPWLIEAPFSFAQRCAVNAVPGLRVHPMRMILLRRMDTGSVIY